MALTRDQIDHFTQQGYLVVEDVFATSEMITYKRACDELSAQAKGLTASTDRFKLQVFGEKTLMVQQVGDPHEMSGTWLDLMKDPRLLDRVEQLLGSNIQLYYSQLMMKASRQGFAAPWHQDFAFFPHDGTRSLACTVAIDDATLENGCLRVIPGSHKLGLLNHYKDGVFTGVVQDFTAFDADTEIPLPAKAGSLLFWHSLTLHSSHPNQSEEPRRALVVEYKDPADRLLAGSFNTRGEVRNIGLMVRGHDPSHDLMSPL